MQAARQRQYLEALRAVRQANSDPKRPSEWQRVAFAPVPSPALCV